MLAVAALLLALVSAQTPCQVAQGAFGAALTAECQAALQYADPLFVAMGDPLEFQGNVSYFLQNCGRPIGMAIHSVFVNCTGTALDLAFLANFRGVVAGHAVLAAVNMDTTPPTPCVFEYFRFLQLAQALNDPAMAGSYVGFLDGNCSKCVDITFDRVLRVTRDPVAVTKLTAARTMCTRRPGLDGVRKICFPDFLALGSMELNSTVIFGNPGLICNPCNYALVSKLELVQERTNQTEALGQTRALRRYLRAICVKSAKGYCVSQLSGVSLAVIQTPGNCPSIFCTTAPTPTAESNCAKFYTDALKDLGCCAGSLLNILDAQAEADCDMGKPCVASSSAFMQQALSGCGLKAPAPCGLKKKIVLTIRNLNFGFCNQNPTNKAICFKAIRDLAYYTTGSNSFDSLINAINSTITKDADNNVIVTFEITNPTVVDDVVADFAPNVTALGEPVPESVFFGANIDDLKLTQGEDLTLSVEASTIGGEGAASFATPLLALVTALVLAISRL